MPTARPSIVARIGAVSDSSMTPESAVRPVIPINTPRAAVISGIPAASSDVNVIASTKNATIMPSDSEPCSASSAAIPPENSTCRPAASPVPAMSASSSRASSEISPEGTG